MSSEAKAVEDTEAESTASAKTVVAEPMVPSTATDESIIQNLPQRDNVKTASKTTALAIATLLLMVDFFRKSVTFEWSSRWENILCQRGRIRRV